MKSLFAGVCALMTFVTLPAHAMCLWNCTPSEGAARSVFENYLRQQTNGAPFTIESFKKLKEYPIANMGREGYVIDVDVVVSFPQGSHPECVSGGGQGYSMKCLTMNTGVRGAIVAEPGERRSMRSSMLFEKTSSGWVGSDGVAY
ncbi:hypothetical protein GIW81_02030 [Hyphomicrobium sp. xq]|uniref:Uncharacterized protein n=1 Tax=Hyphomicrobium album TaxID=2665159 RepID=A0A6I3KEX3_9HYPH|nr:hypothetical protein [Hyphomicrobium album]MTD93108.1 hypothetical protein [Hyphomicrobium album]